MTRSHAAPHPRRPGPRRRRAHDPAGSHRVGLGDAGAPRADRSPHRGRSGRASVPLRLPAARAPPAARSRARGRARRSRGRPSRPVDLDRALRARFMLLRGARGLQGMAVAGIDLAAWDALAVAAGVPLATLLGGEAAAHSRLQQPRECCRPARPPTRRRRPSPRASGGSRSRSAGRRSTRTWPRCGPRAARCPTTPP